MAAMLVRAILGRMPEAADVSDAIDHDIPLSDIESAAGRLDGFVHRTPMLSSATAATWVTRATGLRLLDERRHGDR